MKKVFRRLFEKYKANQRKVRSNLLFLALNVCFVASSLFGAALINSFHNPNELDYIANAIVVNNKRNKQDMSFWQIVPDIDYYGNWHHWQFDETMYSISEFYTTRGFSDHNHTFMINYAKNKEIFICDSDSAHYISVITSPSRVGFKSYGLSLLNNHQPDYKNEFYISKSLFEKLGKESGSLSLSICSTIKDIEYSGVVKSIANNIVNEIVGDDYIVVPYKHAFEIKEYTGHTSFVMCLKNDYYENYAFSRVIKHAFVGIDKGSKYKAYFHDSHYTLDTPFINPNSSLQVSYDEYVKIVPSLAISGYLITLPMVVITLLYNLFILFNKKETNIFLNIFGVFCSFGLYTFISYLLRLRGTKWFFPWSFLSQIIVIVVCILYVLFFLLLHYIYKKKYQSRIIGNNEFFECNI